MGGGVNIPMSITAKKLCKKKNTCNPREDHTKPTTVEGGEMPREPSARSFALSSRLG